MLELLEQLLDLGKPACHQLIGDADLAGRFQRERFGFAPHRLEELAER
jgi:hypothetical protein